MTPPCPELEIVLRLGTVDRRLPLAALSAVLRVSPRVLRERLLPLVVHTPVEKSVQVLEGEPTEGVERFVSISFHRSIDERLTGIVSTMGGGAGEGTGDERHPQTLAQVLASELGDSRSRGYLGHLAQQYPPELLHEALRRTLAVPRERIRTTRGAYFVGVLRALARR